MKNLLRRILFDLIGRRRENVMWRLNIKPIDLTRRRSLVLLGLDGKLGDAILQSSLISAIKKAHPSCQITIVTTVNLGGYWKACEGVAQVHIVSSRSESHIFRRLQELRRLARSSKLYAADVLLSVDPIPMIDYFAFVRWSRPRSAIGLSMMQYALFPISISDPIFEIPPKHVGTRYVRMLAALGMHINLEQLESMVPKSVRTRSLLERSAAHGSPRKLFVNGYGASVTRTFDASQIAYVARECLGLFPSMTILINSNTAQRNSDDIKCLCKTYGERVGLLSANSSIVDLFNFIAQSDAVLTPDTGIAHIAAATNTPVVVTYDDVDFNPICWRPLSKHVVNLVPEAPRAITGFPPLELFQAVKRAIDSLGSAKLNPDSVYPAQELHE